MAREIIWTRRANRQFNKIIDFLEIEWGESVTRNFVERAYGFIESISENGEIGSVENKAKNIRGFLLTKHNRIFL